MEQEGGARRMRQQESLRPTMSLPSSRRVPIAVRYSDCDGGVRLNTRFSHIGGNTKRTKGRFGGREVKSEAKFLRPSIVSLSELLDSRSPSRRSIAGYCGSFRRSGLHYTQHQSYGRQGVYCNHPMRRHRLLPTTQCRNRRRRRKERSPSSIIHHPSSIIHHP